MIPAEPPRWAAAFTLAGVVLGELVVFSDATIALLAPATLGALGLLLLTRCVGDHDDAARARVLRWTLGSFAAHLVFGLIVTNSPSAVLYLGGDAGTYHTVAVWILEFGHRSVAGYLQAGKEGWYYTLVGLYWLFGPHKVAGLALNATLAAALVPLWTDTTRRLFGAGAARFAGPLAVLLPSVFLFTSQLLKEAPILFLLTVGAAAAVRLVERISPLALVTLAVSVSLLFAFRSPVALVAGAAFLTGIALGRRAIVGGLVTAVTVLMGLAVLVVIGVGASGVEESLQASTLSEANRVRSGLSWQSDSGFASGIDTPTRAAALRYLPTALTRFTLGPAPWEVRGARQLPALADVLVLWFLLPSAWRGARRAIRVGGRRVLVLVLPAASLAIMLSLSVGNFGVLVRERIQVVILLIPIVAVGWHARRAGGAGSENASGTIEAADEKRLPAVELQFTYGRGQRWRRTPDARLNGMKGRVGRHGGSSPVAR